MIKIHHFNEAHQLYQQHKISFRLLQGQAFILPERPPGGRDAPARIGRLFAFPRRTGAIAPAQAGCRCGRTPWNAPCVVRSATPRVAPPCA